MSERQQHTHRVERGASALDVPSYVASDVIAHVDIQADAQATVGAAEAVRREGYAYITRRAETFQRAVLLAARAQIEQLSEEALVVSALATELRGVAELARNGEDLDLEAFARADNLAARLLSAPDPTARVDQMQRNLLDPVAGLSDMERRFPSLRQHSPYL